jgi:hypothetical protein
MPGPDPVVQWSELGAKLGASIRELCAPVARRRTEGGSMTYILEVHAAQALGVRVDQLNLPRSEYGVDGDALWVDPRFIEVRRKRAAIAAQMAERRFNVELHRLVRTPE